MLQAQGRKGRACLGVAMSSEISASSMHRLGGEKKDESLGQQVRWKGCVSGLLLYFILRLDSRFMSVQTQNHKERRWPASHVDLVVL